MLLGAPYDRTAGDGCRAGPARLRALSAGTPVVPDEAGRPRGWWDHGAGRLRLAGVRLADAGDVPLPAGLAPEAADGRVEAEVARLLGEGALPVLVGGEHPLTRPAVRAAADHLGEPVTLVALDAHPDRGVSHLGASYPRDAFVDGILADGSAARVLCLGVRDLCHPEHASAPAGFVALPPAELRRLGGDGVRGLLEDDTHVYLSVDVDVLDPSVAPATTTPVPGGLGLWEAAGLLEALAGHPRLVGVDLMEYDPSLDPAGVAGDALLRLLVACLDGAR